MARIYTRVGDTGQTRRIDGQMVPKDDARVLAVGAVDELNSTIGWVYAEASRAGREETTAWVTQVQEELFSLGAVLASVGTEAEASLTVRIPPEAVGRMEQQIDRMQEDTGEQTTFLLPRGCELACRLHMARTVARRAERDVVHFCGQESSTPQEVVQYLNRLADWLYALARWENHAAGIPEQPWKP